MSLLNRLRAATREIHRTLDDSPLAREATFSMDGYIRYSEKFHQGLARSFSALDWETLARLGLPDLEKRRARYQNLGSDLEAIGHPPDPLPGPTGSPSAGRGTGCLYVLEGSVHGGRHLLSALEKNIGPVSDTQTRFMRGFGESTGAMWQSFASWLDTIPASPDFLADAEKSAVRTFDNFVDAFSNPPSSIFLNE